MKTEKTETKKKDIIDDLKELEYINHETIDNDYETKLEKRKKIILMGGAIFLSLLIISYVFLGYPIYGIIIGQMSSSPVKGNVLSTHGVTIIFQGNTLQNSIDAWYNNPDVETTLCLRGRRDENTFIIDNSYQPKIFSQSYFHVSNEPCDDETILMFHTHPYKRCIASETDLNTLEKAKERNQDIAMIIMCEENRFSVYD